MPMPDAMRGRGCGGVTIVRGGIEVGKGARGADDGRRPARRRVAGRGRRAVL